MTEQGAVADNACRGWSVGRRRALRRGPCVLARRTGRPIARLPGASRRSIPLVLRGIRKTGTTGPPRGPKSKPRDSEALAEGHCCKHGTGLVPVVRGFIV